MKQDRIQLNMSNLQIPAVPSFKPTGEPSTVSQRWTKWRKSFEYFVIASGVRNQERKRALLLHLVGPATQDIYETLTDDDQSYDSTIEALEQHFSITKNVPFERSKFHQAKQQQNESVEQYITRLRTLSLYCEYQDNNDQIRDQFIASCSSTKLRKRLLTESQLTLEKILEIGRARESAQHQSNEMETAENSDHQHINAFNKNYTSSKRFQQQRRTTSNHPPKECIRCGARGHSGQECRRSRNATCHKCGKTGHFSSMCRTKSSATPTHPGTIRQLRQ